MFKVIAAAVLSLVSHAAMAQVAPSFYAGGDVGTTKGEGDPHRESGYGAFAGYQINQHVAVELGYRRLVDMDNEVAGYRYHVTTDQLALSAVGSMPVCEKVSVTGRLGYNRLTSKGRGDINGSFSANRALLGLGLAYQVTPTVMARIEVQKPVSEVYNLSAGVALRF